MPVQFKHRNEKARGNKPGPFFMGCVYGKSMVLIYVVIGFTVKIAVSLFRHG